MARVRALEGREAGFVGMLLQKILGAALGKTPNPPKVQAHSTRSMLASALANMLMGSGRWTIGTDLVELVKLRAAALNGCPF